MMVRRLKFKYVGRLSVCLSVRPWPMILLKDLGSVATGGLKVIGFGNPSI